MRNIVFTLLTLAFVLPYGSALALTQTEVSQLYIGVFGRASEGSGNSYWQTDSYSTSMTATANVMLNTLPAKEYFGSTLYDNKAFIEHIYLNTLGKTYSEDPDGIDYWVSELNIGKSKGEVISALIVAAQVPENAGAAQDRFNNKIEVSNYCADNIPEYTYLTLFTGFIANVTDDISSVTSAKGLIDVASGKITNKTPLSFGLTSTAGEISVATSTTSFLLEGIAGDGAVVSVEIDGVSTGSTTAQNSTWSKTVTLHSGLNVIEISAQLGTLYNSTTLYVTCSPDVSFAGPLAVSKDQIKAGTSTDVIFTIAVDQATAVNKIDLLEVNDNAISLSTVATLEDDGVFPDDIPNDNVYSSILTINEAIEGAKYFQTRVQTSTGTGFSEVRPILVYEPLTNEQAAAEMLFMDSAKAVAGGVNKYEFANWLNTQPNITNVVVYSNRVEWVSSNDIASIIYFTTSSGEETDGGHIASRGQVDYSHLVPKSAAKVNSYKLTSYEISDPASMPGNSKALIWAPYYWENGAKAVYNFEDSVESALLASGVFDVTYLKDTNADIESVKNFSSYGVIYLHTHGGTTSDGIFSTGEITTEQKLKDYNDDLNPGTLSGVQIPFMNHTPRLFILGAKGTTDTYFGVTNRFLEDYSGDFSNSFIYLGACTLAMEKIPNTLIAKGANTVVAYVESVLKTYNKKIADTLTTNLLDGKTVEESLATAKELHGNDDAQEEDAAWAKIFGNGNMTILSSGLSNPNFEEEGLMGWTTSGDVRRLQAIGPIAKQEGEYAVVLSTGFGAVDGSTSILSQTLIVPANATTMSFKYNWVSEEPMEWIDGGYNDQFAFEIVDGENTTSLLSLDIDNSSWGVDLGDLFTDGDESTYQVGWKTVSFDMSGYAGKLITLQFRVWDVGDSAYDSAAFIDDITLQ